MSYCINFIFSLRFVFVLFCLPRSLSLSLFLFLTLSLFYGDVYFVRFLRIQHYKITRKLLQNVFCRDSCTFFAMDKKFPWRSKLGSKLTVFWVHKDISKSYREGTAKKLKYRQKPYKMKCWQKVTTYVLSVYKDLSSSY